MEKAGVRDPDAVIDAVIGVAVPNLTGSIAAMRPNHPIAQSVLLGEV